jgi:general secretion pathway protein H
MRIGREDGGFTLLEIVCVLAIVALIAAIAYPAIPRATSRPLLEAYALKAAGLLKEDRNAALRRGAMVATQLNADARTIRSGASGRVLRLPQDVGFRAVLARQCGGSSAGTSVAFLPSGMSCGGTIFLSRPGTMFEVRITWLTGGIEVVQSDAL